MKTNFSVVMLILFPLLKAQSNCNYSESNPISHGYNCEESILIFTSSVDTIVKGSISAADQIFIIPTQNYSILILPSDPCFSCTEPDNTTTVGTKKGGGRIYNRQRETPKADQGNEIVIRRNPVGNILELSLKDGSLKKIMIFNAMGEEIVNTDYVGKTTELNVSNFTKGIYWVKAITNENKIITKEFIKK
ncbi:T9SS type A sorting domain-containing protein [Chryseobacterium sp. KACC 21268]|nr:T9SS type A sorting domain-containing protein [Chryseobacterium sp. KACC 21268]